MTKPFPGPLLFSHWGSKLFSTWKCSHVTGPRVSSMHVSTSDCSPSGAALVLWVTSYLVGYRTVLPEARLLTQQGRAGQGFEPGLWDSREGSFPTPRNPEPTLSVEQLPLG